jgi:hypothetical protein
MVKTRSKKREGLFWRSILEVLLSFVGLCRLFLRLGLKELFGCGRRALEEEKK